MSLRYSFRHLFYGGEVNKKRLYEILKDLDSGSGGGTDVSIADITDADTVDITVTYTDDTTETITFVIQTE